MIDLPDIPDMHTKKIERVLPNTKAEEVVSIFFDRVKPYSNTVNYTDWPIKGETKSFAHMIRPIQRPIDNRLEVTDIIYANWQTKPVQARNPVTVKALILQARQPTNDTVLVNIEFSPFFESIVKDLLLLFEHDRAAPAEAPQASHKPHIPSRLFWLNQWKKHWRDVKGSWKGGQTYEQLAKIAKVKVSTIKKVVKAGDAGLLD